MTSAEATTQRPELPHLSMPRPRTRSTGFWVSLAVHAALIALLWARHDLLVPTPRPGDPRFGNLGGGGGGGGGGERVTYIIALPPASPPAAAVPLPVPPVVTPPKADAPEPTPVPVTVALDTVARQSPSTMAGRDTSAAAGNAAGTAGGSGGGSGGGKGSGNGPGNGPGSGSGAGGEGGGIRPPELRGLAFAFSTPPKELRGKELKVTFAVTADGRVARFETDPEISNRGYYQKFAEAALGYRFRPARGPDGQPVAAVLVMYFTLPTQ